jgi:EmrB/QacA subfamily drug resistance transporter
MSAAARIRMPAARYSFAIPIIVGCAQFMHQFDGSVIATALPSMAKSLNDDPLRLNLAISCYLLALAVFIPISGWMASRFGAKRVFSAAIVIFTISSVFCGISHSLFELVIARTAQGMGGAMMTPVGRLIVVKTAPRADLVKAINYITIPGALAPILGPAVGGFIVTYFSWPWIFFLNLPIGIAGVLLVQNYIPDVKEDDVPPLDLFGFLLAATALASMVFSFESMGRGLVPLPLVIGMVALGITCAAFYFFHFKRTVNPIIDLGLMRVPTFAASITGGSLFYVGTNAVVFLLAVLLQVGLGLSAFQAGLTTLAIASGSLLSRFIIRPLFRQAGFRTILVVNACITGAYLATCGLFRLSTPYTLMLAVLFVGGLSRSIQYTSLTTLSYAEIPKNRMSDATSFSALAQQFAQSFGVGLTALVVHASMVARGHSVLAAADLMPGFLTIGAASFLSTIRFSRLHAAAGADMRGRGDGG